MEVQTYSFMVVCSLASKHGDRVGTDSRLAYTFKIVALGIDACVLA